MEAVFNIELVDSNVEVDQCYKCGMAMVLCAAGKITNQGLASTLDQSSPVAFVLSASLMHRFSMPSSRP